MPNVDLAIVNFHRPPLGTFHCKFMVVDRQIATVSSNNIQDNDNLEMMTHLEGPIVDSLWDTFIVSWHNKLEPPVPCRDSPAAGKPAPTYEEQSFRDLFTSEGLFRESEHSMNDDMPQHMPGDPHYDSSVADEIRRMRSVLNPRGHESHADAVAQHLNKPTGLSLQATAPAREPNLHFFPFIPILPTEAVPMAMASRKPYPNINNESVFVSQNEAFLSLIRNAKQSIFIQT
jgi:phosphatidylserine/phosphatidylglycerophosphate/cardiolipin synthase-like enzyme